MPFSLPDLAEAVRRYLADNLPGRTPRRLHIYTVEDGPEPINLPVIAPIVPPAKESAVADEESGPRVSPCAVDILDVLEAAGKPLATTALLAALARAGKEWSRSHVEKHLADMVRDGTLENPENARPRGYRLPAN